MVNLETFRLMYPEYQGMTDYEITKNLHAAQFSDLPFEQFARQFGGPSEEDEQAVQVREYNKRPPEGPRLPEEVGEGSYLNDK